MTEREQEILALIRQDPLMPQQDLADRLGISRSAVAGHIMNLMQKGHIRGKGYILAQQRYAVVIGGANMDIAGATLAPLRFGDSNPGRVSCSPGGVGRNIAENLARLGTDCRLISVVGDDLWGHSLLETTQRAGVDTRACTMLPDAATSTYLSLNSPDGDMAIAINDMDIIQRLTPDKLNAHRDLVRHAGVIAADTNLSEDALAWLFAHAADVPVFVDTVSAFKAERVRPWLGRIHTLKPNRIEAETLTGLPLKDKADAPRVADWFHERGVRQVILSQGADGLYYSTEHDRGWSGTLCTTVANANGAGDALMAGLVHGWLADLPVADAVRFAQGCAALTLSCPSTNNPTLSEAAVHAFLTA